MKSSSFLEIAMSIQDASAGVLPAQDGLIQALADWQKVMGRSLVLSLSLPLEMLGMWQHTFDIAQRECVDQWICRFGGGVPLDG
jgi:hypothetical protein